MNLLKILFLLFLNISLSFKFQNNNKILNNNKVTNNKLLYNNDKHNNYFIKKNKINNFLELIRYKNIIPSFFLSFSGGFIINSSINELFENTNFIISSIITILIMSTSMIINDLYDIDIDKINNKNRPLVTGEITKSEAIISVILLSSLIEYFNSYLSHNLQIIVNVSLFLIYIYTPIIKKIFLIKNIFCALLISFSIFFSGLSTSESLINNKNYDLFLIEISLIFFGSLYNEILLDITDIKGDKINNINTVPVILGKKNTLIIECFILIYNILSSFYTLLFVSDIKYAILFQFSFIPLIYDLYQIFKNDLDDNYIKKAIRNLNIPLFLSVIYICLLQFTI